MDSIICLECASRVPADHRYCSDCGAELSGSLLSNAEPAEDRRIAELLNAVRETTRGEHEILGELGRGGMAVVFLANDLALRRKVAIKMLRPELATTPGMARRFLQDARIAANLNHPNIISIHAVRETEHLACIVMEYVRGCSLETLIARRGALPEPMAQHIFASIADALAHAHERRVLHRDVKPANILVSVDGVPVLTDFGIAKITDAPGVTATGQVLGSPLYMSPDQWKGDDLTGASDQYSLGLVAYEMMTGRPPFQEDNLGRLMQRHIYDSPTPLGEVVECSDALQEVVMRMLQKEPLKRWPSLDDAVAAARVRPLVRGDSSRELLTTWVTPLVADETAAAAVGQRESNVLKSQPRRRRFARLLYATLSVLLGILVGFVWWMLRPTTGELVLRGLPDSASVFVDGAPTRERSLQLERGLREIRIEGPWLRTTVDTVLIARGEVHDFDYQAQHILMPDDAPNHVMRLLNLVGADKRPSTLQAVKDTALAYFRLTGVALKGRADAAYVAAGAFEILDQLEDGLKWAITALDLDSTDQAYRILVLAIEAKIAERAARSARGSSA